MLALLHRVGQMLRTEMRWRGENNHVYATIDHLLVSIEPDKYVIIGHLNAVFHLAPHELVAATVCKIGERVADRDEQIFWTRGKRVLRRRSAAPAAANEADAHFFTHAGMNSAWYRQRAGKCRGDG